MHDFGAKVTELSAQAERLDRDAIQTDDFAELFSKWERITRGTSYKEKLRAAGNLLANALLRTGDPAKCQYEELHYLMHCVDALSIGAIMVLNAVQANHYPPNYHNMDSFPVLRKKFPALDQDVVLGLVRELSGLNLVQVSEGVISTSDYKHISVKLTAIGARFAERFIDGRF